MADPTVTDVFNQLVGVNGKLDQVEVNTSMIALLNASVNAGFAATVDRLDTVADLQIETLKLVFHLTRQNEAIICALENISRNTCELVNQATVQTRLQQRMAEDLYAVRYLAESTASSAALEYARHKDLKEAIAECCPEEDPRPACEYQRCTDPGPAREPELPEHRDDPEPQGDPVG